MCTDDVRLHTPLTAVWQVELSGHDGLLTWIRRMSEEFAFLEATPLAAEDREDGWILGHALMRGRGKGSPSEIQFELHHAVHFVDGLIDEFDAYLPRQDALDRVGRRLVHAQSD